MSVRRFRYYLACSLDGYVADSNGKVDWLNPYHGTSYLSPKFFAEVDLAIVGRKTHDQAMEFSKGKGMGMTAIVLSSRNLSNLPKGTSVARNPSEAIAHVRSHPGKDVWVVGGGESAQAMLAAGALDTIEMAIMPVVLGAGPRVFSSKQSLQQDFELEECKSYPNGVVGVRYRRKGR